jgi:DNA ligase-4
LENKDQVWRFDAKPRFRVINTVERPCLSAEDLRQLNDHGMFHRVPFARRGPEMDVRIDFPRPHQPTELFRKPLAVEVIGAGFDKPADTRFFTLCFPQIQKIHRDWSFRDSLSFIEYQQLTAESRAIKP